MGHLKQCRLHCFGTRLDNMSFSSPNAYCKTYKPNPPCGNTTNISPSHAVNEGYLDTVRLIFYGQAFAKYSWLRIITAEATNLSPGTADLKNRWLLLAVDTVDGKNTRQQLEAGALRLSSEFWGVMSPYPMEVTVVAV